MTPLTLLIVTFAAYRLGRVVTTDSLFDGIRARLTDPVFDADGDCIPVYRQEYDLDGRPTLLSRRPGLSLLRCKAAQLVTCPHCIGAHVVWVIVCLWVRQWPWELGVRGWIEVLAITGLQSLLTAIDGRS